MATADGYPKSIEEQLAEVYATIDELGALEARLRTAIDNAVTSLQGSPDDHAA